MPDALLIDLDEILETFENLEEWDERYGYLIELGQGLPSMSDELKAPENKVEGCMSRVWLVTRACESESDATLEIIADSDSIIVRGLIALLIAVYSGRTAREILAFDIQSLFATLELKQHLSVSRRNGLGAMVRRIREQAERFV